MSNIKASKKVFKVGDKIIAKIKGCPACPASVIGVKYAATPSKTKYNISLFGTHERVECKPEDLCLQTQIVSAKKKSGPKKNVGTSVSKSTKRKLSGVKQDGPSIKPTPIKPKKSGSFKGIDVVPIILIIRVKEVPIKKTVEHQISETEEGQVSHSGLKIKRKRCSDYEKDGEGPKRSKMSKGKSKVVGKQNSSISVNDRSLEENGNIKDSSSSSETKDTGLKIKPKRCSDYEKDGEGPKRSKISKGKSKVVGKQNSSISVNDRSLGKNDSNSSSETKLTGLKIKPKRCSDYKKDGEGPNRSTVSKGESKVVGKQTSSISVNDCSLEENGNIKASSSSSETKHTGIKIKPKRCSDYKKDGEGPNRSTMSKGESKVVGKQNSSISVNDCSLEKNGNFKDSSSSSETGKMPNKLSHVGLLGTEVSLLNFIHKLRISLNVERPDYKTAIFALDVLGDLQISAFMLKKNKEVVDTIRQVSKYVGNIEKWGLSGKEMEEHHDKITEIRLKAVSLYNKFILLFTVPDGHLFNDIYSNEVDGFNANTKHFSRQQLYGLTSDKMCK